MEGGTTKKKENENILQWMKLLGKEISLEKGKFLKNARRNLIMKFVSLNSKSRFFSGPANFFLPFFLCLYE